jgi:hypothetical protein
MEYEEFLQARYFDVTHADSTKEGSSAPPELSKNTMFMYEGDDDEWIFEAFMFTSASEKWMSIESQVVNVTSSSLCKHVLMNAAATRGEEVQTHEFLSKERRRSLHGSRGSEWR